MKEAIFLDTNEAKNKNGKNIIVGNNIRNQGRKLARGGFNKENKKIKSSPFDKIGSNMIEHTKFASLILALSLVTTYMVVQLMSRNV